MSGTLQTHFIISSKTNNCTQIITYKTGYSRVVNPGCCALCAHGEQSRPKLFIEGCKGNGHQFGRPGPGPRWQVAKTSISATIILQRKIIARKTAEIARLCPALPGVSRIVSRHLLQPSRLMLSSRTSAAHGRGRLYIPSMDCSRRSPLNSQ